MPCGGIYPYSDTWKCWICQVKDTNLFCHEWDMPICIDCLPKFLESDEGRCMLNHGHGVIIKHGECYTLPNGDCISEGCNLHSIKES